jgi:hypothetical protein
MDIEEPWGLSKEALLIYFAVGLLTFRKAPPWIARYLLISFGFKLVRYLLPILEFLLPMELKEYNKFYLRTKEWIGVR